MRGLVTTGTLTVLEQPFGFKHDVLQDTIWGANHPNFSDRGSQLSRPTRAIKVWVSVKTFGMRLFREAISKGIELARAAEQYVVKSEILELLCPVTLSIVCFRVNAANMKLDEEALNDINYSVLYNMFWDDQAFMSSTTLNGIITLRLCIVNHNTSWNDVHETLRRIEEFGLQITTAKYSAESK